MKAKDFDRDKFFEGWASALESGEYKQGKGKLYSHYHGEPEKYCCLGVACKLLADLNLIPKKNWHENGTLPEKAARLLGIPDGGEYNNGDNALYKDNDSGVKFKTIAKTIRRLHKKGKFVPITFPSK